MSTRIQIVSDLHLEFHKDGGKSFIDSLDPDGVDVLVAAGDIGTSRCLEACLTTLADKYQNVIFVPGNHCYYGVSPAKLETIRKRLHKAVPNLHWLEEDTVTIRGQRFLGTTLWFPNTDNCKRHRSWLNDFRVIKNFEPWVFEKNRAAINFLNREVDKDDVVVTHHLPAIESVAERFRGSPLNAFFLCDVRPLVEERGAKLWVHGHTHDSCDYVLDRTRVVCNPMGYPHEPNLGFRDKLVVEIGK